MLGSIPHMSHTGAYVPPTGEGAAPVAHADPGVAAAADFKANHVLAFDVPDSLRYLQTRGAPASMNQPTMFSMVKAVKHHEEGAPAPPARMPAPAPPPGATSPGFEWPGIGDGGLQPLDKLPEQDSSGTYEMIASPFADEASSPSLPAPAVSAPAIDPPVVVPPAITAPTPPPPALPAGHALANSYQVDDGKQLDFDGLTHRGGGGLGNMLAPGAPVKMGDAADSDIQAKYRGTLLFRVDEVEDRKEGMGMKLAIALVVLAIIAALFALLEWNSATTAALDFEESMEDTLGELFKSGETMTADRIVEAINSQCEEASVACDGARGWVRRSTPQAYRDHHDAPIPSGQAVVVVEVGLEVKATAKGWVYSTSEREVSRRFVGVLHPAKVNYGDSRGR